MSKEFLFFFDTIAFLNEYLVLSHLCICSLREVLCGLIQSQLKSELEFKRVQFISVRCRANAIQFKRASQTNEYSRRAQINSDDAIRIQCDNQFVVLTNYFRIISLWKRIVQYR